MLEFYKDKQPLFYDEVTNILNSGKISHAYLIETNNYELKDDLILSFIKTLFCGSQKLNKENCEKCNICNLIDNNSFSDFMIIEPDGNFIKKEQILEVKERFKTTSVENRPRIYLIRQADKLNKQSSNSLLKFLEEPEGNVIAIFEVDNRYKVLETIRSRCQIYSFINIHEKIEFEDFELLFNIVKTLEDNKLKSLAYLPITLDNNNRTKDFWNKIFLEMIELYDNALRKSKNLKYYDYGEILNIINDNNSLDKLIYKISILFDTIKYLEYNLNVNMMLDKFIIEFLGDGSYV